MCFFAESVLLRRTDVMLFCMHFEKSPYLPKALQCSPHFPGPIPPPFPPSLKAVSPLSLTTESFLQYPRRLFPNAHKMASRRCVSARQIPQKNTCLLLVYTVDADKLAPSSLQVNVGCRLLWGAFRGERGSPRSWKGVVSLQGNFGKFIVYYSQLLKIATETETACVIKILLLHGAP